MVQEGQRGSKGILGGPGGSKETQGSQDGAIRVLRVSMRCSSKVQGNPKEIGVSSGILRSGVICYYSVVGLQIL